MDLRAELQHTLGAGHTLERELGGAGMSRVFLALDHELGRRVVVKVLPVGLEGSLAAERFRREIMLAAGLQHPHVVGVLAAGEVAGLPYFLMPYVEGESLRARLAREGPLPVTTVVSIARDIAKALAFAHQRGVVHRDVKPDNILLAGGAAALTDFGVAKALGSAHAAARPTTTGGLTQVGTSLGTPAYMAPEQATGDAAVDHRADLYALGVTMYEMLAGKPPFERDSIAKLLAAHLTEPPPPLPTRRSNVPAALVALVMRCLAKDPEDRPASALDLVRALEDPAAVSGPVASFTGLAPARWLLNRRRTVLAAGAALLVAAGAAAWALAGRQPAAAGADAMVVLPFEDLGSDTTQQYFADGLTEELTSALARVPGIRVASRTAAETFRRREVGPQEIGRRLGVATLLEGTVRREGDQLRLSARLVDARDGLTVWSETYRRQVRDVFALQDSLAAAIVSALSDRLGVSLGAPARRRPSDLQAYDEYLRGRFFVRRRGEGSLQSAIDHFRRAVARDSALAEAWAGLADAYGLLPLYSNAPVDSVLPPALDAVERATRLDSSLAPAYASRGNLLNYAWRWGEAEADLRHALRLEPGNATAHQWLGENLLLRGRVDEAVSELAQAARLDPTSAVIAASYGVALGVARRFGEAIAQGRAAVALDPALSVSSMLLSAVYLYARRTDSAIALLEPLVARAPLAAAQGLLGYAYAAAGRPGDARAMLQRLEAEPDRPGNAGPIARVFLGLGQPDSALVWLDRAAASRDPMFSSESLASRIFDPLRGDPRFAAVLRELNLAVSELLSGP